MKRQRLQWVVAAVTLVLALGTVGAVFWFTRPPDQPRADDRPPVAPSPLDALDPSAIPPEERPDTPPKGLMAVLGSRHCRSWWGNYGWMALRPDGKLIAYADEPQDYSALDPATGLRTTRIGVPFGHGPRLFSADGKRLLGVAKEGEQYKMWEYDVSATVPKGLKFLPLGKNQFDGDVPHELQHSADRTTLVARSHRAELVVFDWPGPGELSIRCAIRDAKVGPYRVSPDGKTVAVNVKSERTEKPKSSVIELWDVSGAEAKRLFDAPSKIDNVLSSSPPELSHWQDGRPTFDFVSEGVLLVMHADQKMREWFTQRDGPTLFQTYQLVEGKVPVADVTELRVDPKRGSLVVLTAEKLFTIEQFKNRPISVVADTIPITVASCQAVPPGGLARLASLEFSADGRRLLTRCNDQGGTFTLWDVTADGLKKLVGTDAIAFDHFGISPDGKTFLGGSPVGLQRYEFGGPAPTPSAPEGVGLHHVWDDLRYGWTFENKRWHYFRPLAPPPQNLTPFDFPMPPLMDQSSSVALSWRFKQEDQSDSELEWRAWDLSKTPAVKVVTGSWTKSRPLLVFAGGKYVLAEGGINGGDRARSLELWTHLANSGVRYVLPAKVERDLYSDAVAVSHDGKLLATAGGAMYRIENDRLIPHKDLHILLPMLSGPPAFSPDGTKVAFAGQVSVWDIASGEKEYEWPLGLTAHKVLFAPDGRHLLTGNANGTAFVLRLP